jgi:magnesium transporter
MYETTIPPELKALKAALAESDAFKVKAALEELYPAQILEHWSAFAPEHRLPILTLLSPSDAAEVFSHLEESEQAELLEALPPWRVKELLEELSPDDLADTINAVEEEKSPEAAEALLRQLDPETRAEVEELAEYEEDKAGGIMTSEYIAVRDSMRVEEVFRFLRREAPDAEQIYVIYVVDDQGHLQGVLTLRDLIVADPKTRVAEIMNPDVIYVRDDTDQEEVARLMADYNFTVLPVVDENKKLVGIVTIDDVVDVIQEEATEDIYRLGAVESPELVYSKSSVFALWSARVRWLIVLIITGSVTSTILHGFESVLEAVTALAFYVPVLVGTGGNTGNQSSTLIVRALATRDVALSDWWRILRKELGVGLLLGLTLSVLLSLKVLLDGQAKLLWVVGTSLALVVLLANVVGAMLPLLLRRLKLDPALISNPLIATVTDVTGLIVYLSVARLLLDL